MDDKYNSEFFDRIYTDGGYNGMYLKSYKETPYYPIWKMILTDWLKPGSSILDIGCGVGQFAQMLYEMEANVSYFGIDFSRVAIEKAEKRCLPKELFNFKQLAIKSLSENFLSLFHRFIALEVLEHLPGDEDVELLKALPKGRTVILSVPNYESEGHFRTFQDPQDIRSRYAEMLAIRAAMPFVINRQGGTIFAVLAKTK